MVQLERMVIILETNNYHKEHIEIPQIEGFEVINESNCSKIYLKDKDTVIPLNPHKSFTLKIPVPQKGRYCLHGNDNSIVVDASKEVEYSIKNDTDLPKFITSKDMLDKMTKINYNGEVLEIKDLDIIFTDNPLVTITYLGE